MAQEQGKAPKSAKKAVPNSIAESDEVKEIARAIRKRTPVTEIVDSERGKWFERHRGVVLRTQHSLGHPIINKTYLRYFEKMSQYLFFIPVIGRAVLTSRNEKDVTAAERAVRSTISHAIKHIESLSAQATALQNTKNLTIGSYNKPFIVEVSYTSPLDKLMFELLIKADEFLLLNGTLWVEGALSDDYDLNERIRSDNEMDVKKTIRNVVYGIIVNHKRILNSIRREQSKVEAAANDAPKESENAGHEVTALVDAVPEAAVA